MQKIKKVGRKIDEGVRRFAQRCEAFGERLERIGREGLAKADEWEKSVQIKINRI